MAEMNTGSHAAMELSESEPGFVTAHLSGELDILSVDRLDGQIDALVARAPARVDLDLSQLDFMDSSGLALLLGLANRFGPLRVLGASPMIRRVIEVTGLTGILRMEEGTP
jgi:anti-sigma B factor antagonist